MMAKDIIPQGQALWEKGLGFWIGGKVIIPQGQALWGNWLGILGWL